jgi:hypothetical protein
MKTLGNSNFKLSENTEAQAIKKNKNSLCPDQVEAVTISPQQR